MVDGSGQVFTINLSNSIPDVSASSVANALNSFVPQGYFILQQQFGISPFLAFILVALMIMMLYYLFAYILFNKLFNDQTLFENIKRPLLVFVFALGVLSAYAIGYLVYIFEIILAAVAISIFILILILVSSGVATGYRAGNYLEHIVASKEYAAAKKRYAAEKEMYKAKKDLVKIKERVKKMEKLLKEKRFGIKTDIFKGYEKSIENVKLISINNLNYIENQIDDINNIITQLEKNPNTTARDYDNVASMLKNLVDAANDGLIPAVKASVQQIEDFYKTFIYGTTQANLSKQHIYKLIVDAKNEIIGKITKINNKISMTKVRLARHGANVSQIGLLQTI